MHFRYRNAPLVSPERRPYWSKLYPDVGGKGLLATVSQPVYRGNQFVATVSLDVAANTLMEIAARHSDSKSRVVFLDSEGVDMAAHDTPAQHFDISRKETISVQGDEEVLILPIPATEWNIAVATARAAMTTKALRESFTYGLLALFTLFSIGLIVFLARSIRKIAALSHRDSLTGLSNRRHFHDLGSIEFARVRRGLQTIGLIVIDIDHFKSYNDALGHSAGDRVLRNVAEVLSKTLKRETDMLFRLGGEEFVIIATVADAAETAALAERLCAAVRAQRIPHPGIATGRLTVSIGAMTVAQRNWQDLDSAFRATDEALYTSKRQGRDRVTTVN